MAEPNPPHSLYTIPDFQFAGGVRKKINIAYRSINPTSTKGTVLILTCYGGHINTTLTFTTGALKDYHVVVVAMIGNGESSSPSNDPDFPKDYSLRYEDCINAQYALLTRHLGVERLETVVGFSMGGQQAYYWAVMHGVGATPFVKRAVVICSSAKTSGHNYAFLEGPVSALRASGDYYGGRYRENGVKPLGGLRAFGRAYAAWLTSAEWFRLELWRVLGAGSLHEWLEMEVRSSEEWDAEDLIVLARMWQKGDVGAVGGGGDWKAALGKVEAKVLVMPCVSDQYFLAAEGEREVECLKNGRYEPIASVWGHMAGGGACEEDTRFMDERIGRFLSEE
ncbi:hypothetical protein M409DRAFT_64073 [Zasmidium cellare ATCC 36951]|uniref:AB hydrolase-1 domain-containing protein n=1 Tax=Zasmidium cellare ATCC 36951 TaxID=1080233 RepID=A0A6A6CZ80_ZASCE|nr:uncharacterized protein M409DRAFT_64073 [Zasmidium cellare ATCC 36951]KAF2171119.1 hypothetical protein M409DRAFT_64073 [Zasmidium cellare ATCC 36951]